VGVEHAAEGEWQAVQIHHSHRGWLILFVLVVAGAYAGYAYELRHGRAALFGPSGGSVVGLIFGIAAATLLLFAALHWLRRWVPAMNSGTWSRAHFWLGALVLPLAWFHGAFRHGGALTSASMWLLYGVVASGMLAAMFRCFVTPWSDEEPVEETFKRLASEAEDVVVPCGPMNGGDVEQWRAERTRLIQSRVELAGGAHPRETLIAAVAAAPVARSEPLKELYIESVKRFLETDAQDCVLADRVRAAQVLRRYRALLPDELHPAVGRLERICDDCRTLRSRERMRRRIDGWMIVHAPLSLALVILVAIHAIYSLRY
jgi:hypothetical protein